MVFNAISSACVLAAVAFSAAYADSRGAHRNVNVNRDDNRHLAVFVRPPWNYDPGTPETGCVDPNTFFDSDVVVTFEGDANSLNARTYSDLEVSFLNSYNTLRSKFCDGESRVVTGVTVDPSSLSTNPLFEQFSLRFVVNVGCDRCSMDTTLFAPDGDDNTRRKTESNESRDLLIYKRPHNIRGASPLSAKPVSTPVATISPPPSPVPNQVDTSFRVSEEECCPPNGEQRAPYASEFVKAFDSSYKAQAIGNRALQANPIQLILKAVEIASVSCEEPLEEFDADVFVEMSGSPEDVTDSEFSVLEISFRDSYNTLGESLCDPLFRTVVQVTAKLDDPDIRHLHEAAGNEGGGRKLQRQRGRFAYRVRAKCRGCRRNPRLFADGVSGRRVLEMQYDRQLQFVVDQDTCYCAVGAEERGVYIDEFTRAYNSSIQGLNERGILKNIESVDGVEEEEIFTWSPTTSPTNFPTAPTDSPVPSPSPSEQPT